MKEFRFMTPESHISKKISECFITYHKCEVNEIIQHTNQIKMS